LSSQGEEQLNLMKQLLAKNIERLKKQGTISDKERLMQEKLQNQLELLLKSNP
jgi:hypothetical protein